MESEMRRERAEGVVVCLSGGMDSATLFHLALQSQRKVFPVFFQYGSKHNEFELPCAEKLCEYFGMASGVELCVIDLRPVMQHFRSDLLLHGGEIPEGHYTDASMTRTVVPGRNMIFGAILAGYAQSVGASEVWMGVHAGDHAIYPDCRPQFVEAMDIAIGAATDHLVSLRAPFLMIDKGSILRLGLALGTPYWMTRTCYKHQLKACGRCGACVERLGAFEECGATDPLVYDFKGAVI